MLCLGTFNYTGKESNLEIEQKFWALAKFNKSVANLVTQIVSTLRGADYDSRADAEP